MIRAIEMAHSGIKKSEVIAAQQHELLYDVFFIGLTMDREYLYERINQRVDRMMKAGLINLHRITVNDFTLKLLCHMNAAGCFADTAFKMNLRTTIFWNFCRA